MTTTQTLLPCVCGGSPEVGETVVFCCECACSTPACPDFPTAVRAWNAMQQAAQPDCVEVLPLTWKINEHNETLQLGDLWDGFVYRSEQGWRWSDDSGSDSNTYDTREEARAALVAYVMEKNLAIHTALAGMFLGDK